MTHRVRGGSPRAHSESAQSLILRLRDVKHNVMDARMQLHRPRRTAKEAARARRLLAAARRGLGYVLTDGNHRSVKGEAEVIQGELEATERMLAQADKTG